MIEQLNRALADVEAKRGKLLDFKAYISDSQVSHNDAIDSVSRMMLAPRLEPKSNGFSADADAVALFNEIANSSN